MRLSGASSSALIFTSTGLGPTNAHTVTVTITFLGTYATSGAYVSFALYDVDMDPTFADQIRNITAQKLGGGTIGLTETGSASNVVANSGISTTATVTGTGSTSNHTGDVLFQFGGK